MWAVLPQGKNLNREVFIEGDYCIDRFALYAFVFIREQGGMKAVVWTDVFQALVMIGGMLAIVIQVLLLLTL